MSDGIARRIRAERTQRDWSLAELAQRSGVSKAMLSAIERGETSPTATLLVRIAAAFGVTLSALIARAETNGGGWRAPASSRNGAIPRPATSADIFRRPPTCRWS